ncbi:MAG: hypothetical protein IJ047_05665 [Paludibacteraceae bacterium]|nr:hypothetical protein [Paludibacteraceae bacterium]
MKKVFMSLAAVAVMALAAGFTSCDPNKEQCWKITLTSPDGGQVVEYYYYGNGVDSDAQLELLASSMPGFKATKTQTFLSKDNCKK